MSTIEANITIDIPDGIDPQEMINSLRYQISNINGKDTHVNIVEVDNPLSLSPITMKKIKD